MYSLVLLPEWDCSTCTKLQKFDRGCEGNAKRPIEFDGEPQMTCPRRPLLDDPLWYDELFWLYGNFKNGIFPEPGGLSNQPHKLMMAIRELDRAQKAAESEKEEGDKRKSAIREKAARVIGKG